MPPSSSLRLVSATLLETGGVHVCMHALLCVPSSACSRYAQTAQPRPKNRPLNIVSCLWIRGGVTLCVFLQSALHWSAPWNLLTMLWNVFEVDHIMCVCVGVCACVCPSHQCVPPKPCAVCTISPLNSRPAHFDTNVQHLQPTQVFRRTGSVTWVV